MYNKDGDTLYTRKHVTTLMTLMGKLFCNAVVAALPSSRHCKGAGVEARTQAFDIRDCVIILKEKGVGFVVLDCCFSFGGGFRIGGWRRGQIL